jgi:hypothetical protein
MFSLCLLILGVFGRYGVIFAAVWVGLLRTDTLIPLYRTASITNDHNEVRSEVNV